MNAATVGHPQRAHSPTTETRSHPRLTRAFRSAAERARATAFAKGAVTIALWPFAHATRPRYLTVDEVAELLRQDRATIYRKVKLGTIPAIRLMSEGRGALRIPEDELRAWLLADGDA